MKVLSTSLLVLKKHAPTIILGVGVAGVVGATVVAVKKAPHAKEVIDTTKESKQNLKEKIGREMLVAEETFEKYTEKDYKKECCNLYKDTAITLTKMYAAPAILYSGALAAIFASHSIMLRRYAIAAAAYASTSEAFESYRKRVKEAIGEEKERNIYYDIKEIKVKDPKSKKMVKVKEIGPEGGSMYSRFFDETCPNWTKDNHDYNIKFCLDTQAWANDILWSRENHTVFLNEVYDAFGFERSSVGQVVGWHLPPNLYNLPYEEYLEEIQKEGSDGYIDFNIFDVSSDVKRAFVNGIEPAILLDFNVDGIVYDKI
ncbi:MAG: hypothetical protein HUJ62_05570 [Streptococcus gallolyticus]|nr:hypothetical protein [Streptococcus gallolyticus]